MNAKDIWQEIKNIKGHPTAVKTLIPNEEAKNLARHFVTRAAHDTLPEDVKHSLKQLQGQRRQSVLQAKLASTDTDVPFSINELEAVQKKRTVHQDKTVSLSPFTQTPHPPLRKESLISSINHGSKVASQFNGKLQ